ncbi:MAG: mucin desulfatase, partial [Oscillospiraceae bacterium]
MATAEQSIHEALNAFEFGAELVGAVRFGKGHINDTFVVHTQPPEDDCRRFILQRVSAAAF